jgi:tRNA threonylcarbamoyladenosine biosynthesis protein TsaE
MSARLITSCAEETEAAGRALAECVSSGDVILLTGDLGAGKTVLVKGVAAGLSVSEPVTSPTFNILVVHQGTMPLHHFDLYRLEHSAELIDIDYHGTLESPGISLVEWGDRFPEARPEEYLLVEMLITGDTSRDLACSARGSRSAELLSCWMRACAEVDVAVAHAKGDEEAEG